MHIFSPYPLRAGILQYTMMARGLHQAGISDVVVETDVRAICHFKVVLLLGDNDRAFSLTRLLGHTCGSSIPFEAAMNAGGGCASITHQFSMELCSTSNSVLITYLNTDTPFIYGFPSFNPTIII